MPLRVPIFASFVMLLLASVATAQQTATATVVATPTIPWSSCFGLGSSGVVTLDIGQFTDPLPSNTVVRSVSVSWAIGNGKQYSYEATPGVFVSLNGTQIGQPASVTNFSVCSLSSSLPYAFASGDNFAGYPAYNHGGVNQLTATISGGAVFPSGYPVVTITYNIPDAIEFNVTNAAPPEDRRVLLSNVRPNYSYPHFQSIGGLDAAVPMFVRARGPNHQYQSGRPVYLRITDPADPSAYMNLPQNVLAHTNDNHGPLAILTGSSVTADAAHAGVYQATSGTNGIVNFTLQLASGTAGGDNYEVEASFDPSFPANASWKSGTLTAWKRVFVEKRRMAQNGLFIQQTANAGASSLVIRGNRYRGNTGSDRLRARDTIVVIHAPALDRRDALNGWYYETHTVLDVTDVGNGFYEISLGTRAGKTIMPEVLGRTFNPDPVDGSLGDAIVKVSNVGASPDVFDVRDDLVIGDLFRDAFVEYIYLPDNMTQGATTPVPFVMSLDQPFLQKLADKWSSVVSWTGTRGAASPNHQLLIAAHGEPPLKPNAAGNLTTGLTISRVRDETSSWIFRHAIDETARARHVDSDLWAAKTAAHEIAHEWRTNGVWSATTDHCPIGTTAFDQPLIFCLLAEADAATSETQRANGIARFHLLQKPDGTWHSEYLEIRHRSDPFVP